MPYLLACFHCGSRITATDRPGDAEVAAVEAHLRAAHPDRLPAARHVDFAEVRGHVRVKMGDDTAQGGDAFDFVTLGARVPKSLHRAVMFHCIETDVTLMDFVVGALEERLAKVRQRACNKPRETGGR
jgi:hypothetical protein